MGPCIAGGAYLPALSDVIIMVEGVSFMGLGGPNLVKGATGQVDRFRIAGRRAPAHRHRAAWPTTWPPTTPIAWRASASASANCPRPRARPLGRRAAPRPEDLYGVLPADHRLPYEIEEVISRIFDAGDYAEFQPEYAPEMLCANARLAGRPVAVIANRRGFLKAQGRPRIGGIIYAESARKVAYFVETSERLGHPLVYLQDVSGFMVGPEAEREGIIRAGAEMVETMSCATVPKIVLTLNHASGAGYYAMAGQGFDPNFTFSWPTARIGVMEGESAVQALFAAELEQAQGRPGSRRAARRHRKNARRLRALAGRPLCRRAGPLRCRHRSAGFPRVSRLRAGGLLQRGPRGMARAPREARRGRPAPRKRGLMIRIANGQGFWGDWLEAPVRLIDQGPIDYLTLDYLAEVTMSILQKQKQADPNLGYARDFPPLVARIARKIRDRGVKVIANAGGVNPVACAREVLRAGARPEGSGGAGRRCVRAPRRVPGQRLRDARHG